jgi:hypothetical protein
LIGRAAGGGSGWRRAHHEHAPSISGEAAADRLCSGIGSAPTRAASAGCLLPSRPRSRAPRLPPSRPRPARAGAGFLKGPQVLELRTGERLGADARLVVGGSHLMQPDFPFLDRSAEHGVRPGDVAHGLRDFFLLSAWGHGRRSGARAPAYETREYP